MAFSQLTLSGPPPFGHPATWHVTAFDALGAIEWRYTRTTGYTVDAAAELANGQFAVATGGDFSVERLNASGQLRWTVPLFTRETTPSGSHPFVLPLLMQLSDGSLLALATRVAPQNTTNLPNHELAAARVLSDHQSVS